MAHPGWQHESEHVSAVLKEKTHLRQRIHGAPVKLLDSTKNYRTGIEFDVCF